MHRCRKESYKGENNKYMVEMGKAEYYYKY